MRTRDRRTTLIGSGLVMALALTLAGGAAAQTSDPTPRLKVGDQWNHGDDPWDAHPGNYKFNPKAVGIIHLELLDGFRIKATRFHYDSVKDSTGSSWDINQTTAIKVINWLNGPRTESPPVTPICQTEGLMNLIFGQPHHVVIYIKNGNVEYPERPIWFGNSLQGTVKGGEGYQKGRARENHSFFKAKILMPSGKDEIIGEVSQQFIYFENHFHKHGLLSGHDPIREGEFRVYSMKIALLSQSIVDKKEESKIPIIIDPDTGNMGGGKPFVCDGE